MTIEIKVPTPTQSLVNLSSKKREELEDVSIQIATGNKHQDFQGFASEGNVEKFISLETTIKTTDLYIKSNEIILGRTKTMEQTLDQIITIADDVQNTIAGRINGATGANSSIGVISEAFFDSIESALNTRYDGRYLFAGSKTDTKPVDGIKNSTNVDSNTLVTNANYYQGNSSVVLANISQSEQLSYGVTANNEAFQKLIGAVNLLVEGDASNDNEILSDALNMINEAVEEVVSLSASTSSASERILEINLVHQSVGSLAIQSFSDVAFVRTEVAATKMFELEAIIEATYLAFNRLSGLRLSNFLS